MQYYYAESTKGFYVDAVHGSNIPADSVAISDAEHQAYVDALSQGKILVTLSAGEKPVVQDQPAPPLDTAKEAKLEEINHAADKELAALLNAYPNSETISWAKQEDEARKWLVDNNSPTPMLTPMAAARGLAMDDLCARVIAKADTFAAYSGDIFGKRQAMEDQLDLCTTAEEVAALVVAF